MVSDHERLEWLCENFHRVLKLGKTWYSMRTYAAPARRHQTMRDAIDFEMKRDLT